MGNAVTHVHPGSGYSNGPHPEAEAVPQSVPHAASYPPNVSVMAARMASGARWLYCSVTAVELWPRMPAITRMGTPFIASHEAVVCRRLWKCKRSSSFASRTISL